MNHQLWIDGKWEDTQGGKVMSIENPATGEAIAEVIDASREDVDRAVQAAKHAFYDGRWSKISPGERSKAIWKLADLLEANAESLAKLESDNTGKPYQYVSLGGDIPFAVDNLRFFAGAAREPLTAEPLYHNTRGSPAISGVASKLMIREQDAECRAISRTVISSRRHSLRARG